MTTPQGASEQAAEAELAELRESLRCTRAELEASRELLRAALELCDDGVVVTDDGRRTIASNSRFAELWGLPATGTERVDFRGVLVEASCRLDDPAAFLARAGELEAAGADVTNDLVRLADGRALEWSSRLRRVAGRPAERVWSFRDVSFRLRAQADQARLAAIVESSHDVVVSKTLDGTIRTWNEEAQRVFGYTAEEAIGQPITLIVPPERRQEEEEIMARLRRGERVDHFETERIGKDGRRVELSVTISPIRDAQGRPIGASKVARDITERRRHEEALRDAARRKDEFLAVLAHELRNPLAPLRNGLEILRLSAADEEAAVQARSMMERQLGHLVRLVDDLFDVSRISRGKLELRRSRVQVRDVLGSALETAAPSIEAAGHRLVVSLPSEPIEVEGDLTRLAQVFGNLLSNAVKFTPAGGRIGVGVETGSSEVKVTVSDSGIGIPAEALPGIFELFSQVDRSLERTTGGLGIGLALVRGLVEMHGGSVDARSDGSGRGSAFTVRLPVLRVEPERAAAPGDSRSYPHLVGLRILVADDNRDSAGSMALMLRLLGNQVETVHDGLAAAEAAERLRPDLVLMDVGMPLCNGYDATRRIRAQPWGGEIVVIALTGWGQESDRARSRAAGCDAHLIKPVDLTQLDRLFADAARR